MLTGKAKIDYMRDYMRRKRAGLATRKEPKPRSSSPRRRSGPLVFCAVCGDMQMPDDPIFLTFDDPAISDGICERCADKVCELVAKARSRD